MKIQKSFTLFSIMVILALGLVSCGQIEEPVEDSSLLDGITGGAIIEDTTDDSSVTDTSGEEVLESNGPTELPSLEGFAE